MEIKKYNQFITERYNGNRSFNIENDIHQKYGSGYEDLVKWLKDIAPWYLENGDEIMPIYRGVRVFKYEKTNRDFVKILKVQPSKFKRQAANTHNFYIDLMDGSPLWEGYPKRSKSIICSTNYKYANDYGEVFRVIPLKENETFAVCSENDAFLSFPYLASTLKNISGSGMTFTIAGFNNWLMTFGLQNGDDYETIKNKIETNIHKILNDEHFERSNWHNFDGYTSALKRHIKEGTIYADTLFEDILSWMSPENNKFRKIEYNRNTRYSEDFNDKEVWTEADCVLIDEILFQNILEEYKNWG
jgi:hypothetical protein